MEVVGEGFQRARPRQGDPLAIGLHRPHNPRNFLSHDVGPGIQARPGSRWQALLNAVCG